MHGYEIINELGEDEGRVVGQDIDGRRRIANDSGPADRRLADV